MKKIIIIIIVFLFFTKNSYAYMPEIYPIFGYDKKSNFCSIKQPTKKDLVNENLSGNYSTLQECRRENPKIILNTGLGIFIWILFFVLVFIFNFFIYSKFKNKTIIEKKVDFIIDIILIFILVFLNVLVYYYFGYHSTSFGHEQGLDSLIYLYFIKIQNPLSILIFYILISFFRTILILKKTRF